MWKSIEPFYEIVNILLFPYILYFLHISVSCIKLHLAFCLVSVCNQPRNKTFGRSKKGADNKGATKRAQNKKGAGKKGEEQKGRRAKRAQSKKGAEQKGRRTKRARDHDVASPLHSRS